MVKITILPFREQGLYTAIMSLFAHPTPAPEPKSRDVVRISTFYAGLLVVMAVAQLFTFESFLELFDSFGLPGGTVFAYVLASVLVTAEVFALPFLLRMRISVAFRWFSAMLGGLVADIWLFVTLWVQFTAPPVETIGFLGTAVDMMPGWWAVLISTSFGILAIWALWGMWPSTVKGRSKKSRK